MLNYLFKKIALILNLDLKHVLSGFSWLSLTQGIGVISSLAVTYFFANTLSEADYGTYRYVLGLGVLLASFSLTGISQTVLQATARGFKNFLVETTKITIIYGLVTAGISFGAAGYYFYMQNTLLAWGCLLIAVTYPVTQLFSNIVAYQNGLEEFRKTSILQIFRSVLVSAGSLLALLFTQNVLVLLVVFFSFQTLVALLSLFIFFPKKTTATPTEFFYKNLSFAKHTSFRNWFLILASKLDSVLIFQNLGSIELAAYSIANLVPDQVKALFKQVQSVLVPKYSKHESLSTLKKFIFLRSVQLLTILVIVTIISVALVPSLITFVFPAYTNVTFYAQLLLLSVPTVITVIPVSALNVLHKERELYFYQVSTSLIQIGILVTLLFMYGLIGAILAKVVAQYIRLFIAYALVIQAKD